MIKGQAFYFALSARSWTPQVLSANNYCATHSNPSMNHSLLILLTTAATFLFLSGCEKAQQESGVEMESNMEQQPVILKTPRKPEAIASDKELQAIYEAITVGKTTLRQVHQAMKMSYSDSLGEQTRWGHTDSYGNGLYLSLSNSVVTAKSRNREDIFAD